MTTELAMTKTVNGAQYPASCFLVVEDPQAPNTWHLPVLDPDGTPNHRLMGAAKAALTTGFRGQKYSGPGKAAALSKLKKLYEKEGMNFMAAGGFLFVDLSAMDISKPFDGLAVGKFYDMHGNAVEFKAKDFPKLVKHTQDAIDASKTDSGEIVGLPIDGSNHDKGDAAGWIVGVELAEAGDKVRFVPKWTELGLELIGKGLRRMFSATVDIAELVVLGGTLTNWPAIRDATGKMLLRPIELSSPLFEFDASLDEQSMQARMAFNEQMADPQPVVYVREVFADHLIVCSDDKMYSVSYTVGADGEYVFASQDAWVEVQQTYVNAASATVIVTKADNITYSGGDAEANKAKQGVLEMDITEKDLTDRITAAVTAALAAQQPPDPKSVDLSSLLEIDGLTEEAKKQRKLELQAQLTAIRKQAELEYRAELVRLEFENRVAELSQRLVNGTDKSPRGLRVAADDLRTHFLKMDPEEAKWWGELLTNTLDGGVVEFVELGHSKTMQGTQLLPDPIRVSLKTWVSAGQKIEEFFRLNAVELGAMSDYNLAEFMQPKEK